MNCERFLNGYQTLAKTTANGYNITIMDNTTVLTELDSDKLTDMKTVGAIPMVALRGKVILPSVTTSFDVGREKSLRALSAALAGDEDALLFVASQIDSSIENPTLADVYDVGVVCRIKHCTRMPGDSLRVNVDALYAARIAEVCSEEEFFFVRVEEYAPEVGDPTETEAYSRFVKDELRAYLTSDGARTMKDPFPTILAMDDADAFVNAATYNFRFKEPDKQRILELRTVTEKLRAFYELLAGEIEIAKTQKEISEKVKSGIEKNQREYYLREELKAIHEELGDDTDELDELKRRILDKKMPTEVEDKALKELARMDKMNPSSPDYTVLGGYLDWLLDLPYNEETKDETDLKSAEKILDEDHYGLEKVKRRITEYLAVLKLTGKVGGSILCLYGPPGVGKTSVAKSVARALNRKFVRMSLGGVKDEAEIRGHRKTYVGAIPGRIIYAMKEAGTVNPVILLDEIDKLSSDLRGDPASALLEVLDPEQNSTFRDRYLEVPYDLSKVLFITTANTLDTVPAPLLDRMEVIELGGYTRNEKFEIAKRYLIPKEKEKNGISSYTVNFTEDGIYELIDGYTKEAGVRNLEREIGGVCRKIATKIAEGVRRKRFIVDTAEVKNLLGAERFSATDELRGDEIGAATGLAWTSVGGVTLTIEVALMKGKGALMLTGKLGEVMQESAKIACSYVRLHTAELGIDPTVFENTDIHIHVPEGATPKDGPSAGITITTAVISAFTGRKVRGDVAMTGEVTLRGKVLPIGGLKEKSLAAFRLGIRNIIIPKGNVKDLEEIPENIRAELTFNHVENMNEVCAIALKDADN